MPAARIISDPTASTKNHEVLNQIQKLKTLKKGDRIPLSTPKEKFMKLQLTVLASARQLAVTTARFQVLASTELDPQQIAKLSQRLEDNLFLRIGLLADTAMLRIRDRPKLNETAKHSFQRELARIKKNMSQGSQTVQ